MAAELTDEQIDALIGAVQKHLGGWTQSACGSRSRAIEKVRNDVRALLATQGAEPDGWLYELDKGENKGGPVYLGSDSESVTRTVAADEGATPFPFWKAPPHTAEVEKDDARIVADFEALQKRRADALAALLQSKVGAECHMCHQGVYVLDGNGYHAFNRCSKCGDVPMWDDHGQDWRLERIAALQSDQAQAGKGE